MPDPTRRLPTQAGPSDAMMALLAAVPITPVLVLEDADRAEVVGRRAMLKGGLHLFEAAFVVSPGLTATVVDAARACSLPVLPGSRPPAAVVSVGGSSLARAGMIIFEIESASPDAVRLGLERQ